MLVYSATSKTKSGELLISKSIVALVISSDQAFSAVANEKITIAIERSKGSNLEIATNVPLRDIMLLSNSDLTAVKSTATGFVGLVILGPVAYNLGENENIKVSLTDLKSLSTYSINTLESPFSGFDTYRYERKTATTDEISKAFQVDGYKLAFVSGMDAVTEISLTYANGNRIKMLPEEVRALAWFNDINSVIHEGANVDYPANETMLDLEGVVSLEVQKSTDAPVIFTLKSF